jgi:hypothetical protein
VATDPDHHLWRNGRLWWVAFTVLEDGWRQRRVRLSLQTDDVEVARKRREQLFHLVDEAERCRVSLRFGKSKRGRRRKASPRSCVHKTDKRNARLDQPRGQAHHLVLNRRNLAGSI